MLDTYDDLLAEIGEHLHRDDLDAKAPLLVKLFEARLNRRHRHLQRESALSVPVLAGQSSADLPTGVVEVRGVWLDGYPLAKALPDDLLGVVASLAQPCHWAAVGGALVLDTLAPADLTLKVHAIQRWDLSADGTNWLLRNHPDIYLYGSLATATAYIGNDERIALWSDMAASALDELEAQETRTRGGVPMRADPALVGRRHYDIYADR